MKKINFNGTIARSIIILILSVFPTIVASGSFYKMSSDSAAKNIVTSINTLNFKQAKSVEDWVLEKISDLKFYSYLDYFQNLNIPKMKEILEYTAYSEPPFKTLYAFNNEGKSLTFSSYYIPRNADITHIQSALKGQVGISQEFKIRTDTYFEIAVPIIKNEVVIGGICGRININSLNKLMKSIEIDGSTESYIVDEKGVFLTEPKYYIDAVGNKSVNLKQIKTSIDYSSTLPYKNYKGEDVYGSYTNIDGFGWVLIVEQRVSKNDNIYDNIRKTSQIIVMLQLLSLLVYKKLINKLTKPNLDKSSKQDEPLLTDEDIQEIVDTVLTDKPNIKK